MPEPADNVVPLYPVAPPAAADVEAPPLEAAALPETLGEPEPTGGRRRPPVAGRGRRRSGRSAMFSRTRFRRMRSSPLAPAMPGSRLPMPPRFSTGCRSVSSSARDNVAIYANRTLLDLLGFADEDAFHAAGGMARMFNLAPTGSDMIGVRTASGESFSARARLQAIEWDDLPATLLTLRRDEKAEQTAQLEADLRTQKGEGARTLRHSRYGDGRSCHCRSGRPHRIAQPFGRGTPSAMTRARLPASL